MGYKPRQTKSIGTSPPPKSPLERRRRSAIRQLQALHKRIGAEALKNPEISAATLTVVESELERATEALTRAKRDTRALVYLEGVMVQLATSFWEAPGLVVAAPKVFALQLQMYWAGFAADFPEWEDRLPVEQLIQYALAYAQAFEKGRPRGNPKPIKKWDALRELAIAIGIINSSHDTEHLRRRIQKAKKNMYPEKG